MGKGGEEGGKGEEVEKEEGSKRIERGEGKRKRREEERGEGGEKRKRREEGEGKGREGGKGREEGEKGEEVEIGRKRIVKGQGKKLFSARSSIRYTN